MKKIVLMAALVSGLSFAGLAQNNNPRAGREQRQNMTPDQRAAQDADRAEKKLGLNADQKSKWQAASLERINANEPLRDKMKGSTTPDERGQARTQMKSNNDKFDAAVSSFLTPEQKAQYEQMKTQRHGKGQGPMKKDKSGGQPNMMAPTNNH